MFVGRLSQTHSNSRKGGLLEKPHECAATVLWVHESRHIAVLTKNGKVLYSSVCRTVWVWRGPATIGGIWPRWAKVLHYWRHQAWTGVDQSAVCVHQVMTDHLNSPCIYQHIALASQLDSITQLHCSHVKTLTVHCDSESMNNMPIISIWT